MFRAFGISTFVIAALLSAASAEPAAVQGTSKVSYGDLDLSTASGARAMLTRIEKAATQACGRSPFLREPHSPTIRYAMYDYRQCREQAVAQAVASLRAPAVSRLYAESRAGRPGHVAGR